MSNFPPTLWLGLLATLSVVCSGQDPCSGGAQDGPDRVRHAQPPAAAAAPPPPLVNPPIKPNVLMIVVDDMNDWVGCLGGHPDVKTPNMDRLARRGMLFANAHAAAPVCNPSRVATLTGRRPASTGIYANNVVWHEALPGVVSMPQHFGANGYYVAGGGKLNHHAPRFNRRSDWHEYFDQVFDGYFQDRQSRGLDVRDGVWPAGLPLNQLPAVKELRKPPLNPYEFDWGPFDKPDEQMGDGQMVEWAARFLARPAKQPFFLAAGIFRPHLPFYAPRKYFDLYPPSRITLPPLLADDVDDLPTAGQKMAAGRRGDLELVIHAGQYRELVRAYLASISFADMLIGRLLDALDASPAAKNTIVALWSDHGWHLGEKQQLHKFTLWERSTHVPFIIVAPSVTRENTRSTRPVGLVDLFPTLTELCSLPPVEGQEGSSLVPLLRDPARDWERPAVTTHSRGNHAVRSERWRYIRYADGGEELYDHGEDPHEWHNLASKPEFLDVKLEHAKWLPKADAPPAGVGTNTRVVAHRGLLREYPENTLVNFRTCLERHLGFELDVRRSRDGQLVCVHDDDLDRTTNGQGPVADRTLAELKSLDAGSWFGARFRNERIPTIDEIFLLVAQREKFGGLIAVDLKGADPQIEADVVAIARRHGVLDRLLMIGRAIDQPEVRRRLRAADAKSPVACLAPGPAELDRAIADRDSDWVYVRFVPDVPQAKRVHAAGKRLFLAGPTVATHQLDNWRLAAANGVDAILTDYAVELAGQLLGRSAATP